MKREELIGGVILSGPMFNDAVVIDQVRWMTDTVVQIVGKGRSTGAPFNRVLTLGDLSRIAVSAAGGDFSGDPARFRLGIEAIRLGLAHEYDPLYSVSVSRVEPLPHQLEAVYEHFLRLPRIRFLLADDPGAGKTIMAGLLLKELKARGLVRRVLILTPANLTFQWKREMFDKFRESFEVLNGATLRSAYGVNPFDDKSQVISSITWVSTIPDARESLLRTRWDLIVVDEAHKMAAYADRETLAYKIGAALRDLTDHYLLMTATPHKGDTENFCRFLELLDKDVYASVTSLEEAMRRNRAPFYLRRTKEAMVGFPDPVTGVCPKLYVPRHVTTASFQLSDDEMGFYEALTDYVEEQSVKVVDDQSARGRAIGFTMAMLQRRQASSVYAVRKTLERMRDRRQDILNDPKAWREEQVAKRLAHYDEESFEELEEDEQDKIVRELEAVVEAASNPEVLKRDIQSLEALIQRALRLEASDQEVKLKKLQSVLAELDIPADPDQKLLIFTEHRDTLDFLCGDGKEGRPLGKLLQWGVKTTQIHGSMKVGDAKTVNTRIYAEREFHDSAQVMVATEAAGEGINLQFCHRMINYDIPWNPMRLEQRMGRIHRFGQTKDCYAINFVSSNTREGRVLQKLLERLDLIREQLQSDQVFDVIGEVIPGNLLESLFRQMYARRMDEASIVEKVSQIDAERFKRITRSTLEGLARRSLNLATLLGHGAEARSRRMVPEVVRDFFLQGAALAALSPTPDPKCDVIYRLGDLSREVSDQGRTLEARHGVLASRYERITFEKKLPDKAPTADWLTPGHPLFEALREVVRAKTERDLQRGAHFHDLNATEVSTLDIFEASVIDGRNSPLGRRLFVVRTVRSGGHTLHEPTLLLDMVPAIGELPPPADLPDASREAVEGFLVTEALMPYRDEVAQWRVRELDTVALHIEVSLRDLLHRANERYSDMQTRHDRGTQGLEGHIKQELDHITELHRRLRTRQAEELQQREIHPGPFRHIGRACVSPHPARTQSAVSPMVRDEEIERIAVQVAMAHERAEGWVVESVEADNQGFDLISRKPHPAHEGEFIAVRFIEVKGRAHEGDVALTTNEYKTAERLRGDYWLYVVHDCATAPRLSTLRDPWALRFEPITQIAHYRLSADQIPS